MLNRFVRFGLFTLGLFAVGQTPAVSQDTGKGRTLEVRVNYTGAGAVDEKHPLYIVLWNTAAFVEPGSGATPIAVKPVRSKDGTAVFDNVGVNPAYVSAAYDPTGKWEANSPPPSGSSLGLYATEDGKPKPVPVNADKAARIEMNVDDSIKVP